LLLLINDSWRIFLRTDHPNGACFWRYPEILHLLATSFPMVVLAPKDQPPVPLEAEIFSPDHFVDLDNATIRALPVFLGKRQLREDDFFTVDGEGGDEAEIRGEIKLCWRAPISGP
jgi:hypothetical protein